MFQKKTLDTVTALCYSSFTVDNRDGLAAHSCQPKSKRFMKVKELIEKLQKVNPEARCFMGYDGDVVVTEPTEVEEIFSKKAIAPCWLSVEVGDVVILSDGS
jgi:hypothetical protein